MDYTQKYLRINQLFREKSDHMKKSWVNYFSLVYLWAGLGQRADMLGASTLRRPVLFVVSNRHFEQHTCW